MAGTGTGPSFSCSLGSPFPTKSLIFHSAPADVLIACCIWNTHPKPLRENKVPVTGTERSRMSQSLVLQLQSGISVKWVTFCSDVFNARKQIRLSCCLTWESARALATPGIHTPCLCTGTGKAFSLLSSLVLPCWLSSALKSPF